MKTLRFPFRSLPLCSALLAILIPLVLGPLAAAAAPVPPEPGQAETAVKRGEAVFRASCQGCHSLKYSGYEAKLTAANARRAFGKPSPDLNLMTKARGGGSKGAAYVAALLAGYDDSPEKNSVFPNIAMPPPLAKGDPQLLQKARDVAAFLDAEADPFRSQRIRLGRLVLSYMVFLSFLLYALNRRTWRRVCRKTP